MQGQKKTLPARDQQRRKKYIKVFTRALSFVLMESFLSQETLSHPLLVPILEDPKMELKTFLLPLRLGLLTAFHQNNEVIFLSYFLLFLFTVDKLFLTDLELCKGVQPVCLFPLILDNKCALETRWARLVASWQSSNLNVLPFVSTAVGRLQPNL